VNLLSSQVAETQPRVSASISGARGRDCFGRLVDQNRESGKPGRRVSVSKKHELATYPGILTG
jgi:hypothetical protein